MASLATGSGDRQRAHFDEDARRGRIRTRLLDYELRSFRYGSVSGATASAGRGRIEPRSRELPQGNHSGSRRKSQEGRVQKGRCRRYYAQGMTGVERAADDPVKVAGEAAYRV